MKLLYKGKTKDVYQTENENEVLLQFKDDVTGTDGVFDPGANTVGLRIEGAGQSGLRMTSHFFEELNNRGFQTHYISSDLEKATMTVKKADSFGRGLEIICRFRAVGSFYRRYGAYCTEGQDLGQLIEFTLKDDERGDPVIQKETLITLGLLKEEEYEQIQEDARKICLFVKEELASKNLDLYDIKLEFGKDTEGNIILIDEISGGNMRVYQQGKYIEPLALEKAFLS